MTRKVEYKTFVDTKVLDEDQGIVEHLFSVYGVRDHVNDIVHAGAFAKTISEAGSKIRVLDGHATDSIMRVIGKPLGFREVDRDGLPDAVKAAYPSATGGMVAKVQYLMDTKEGEGAFKRIKAGAIDESSYAYNVIRSDLSEVKGENGEPIKVRNLRELRLIEVSPVIWGANSATTVMSAKGLPEGVEAKPWRIIKEGDQFCVYKEDAEGSPVGDALGCHRTRAEAEDQLAALYANEQQASLDIDLVVKGWAGTLDDLAAMIRETKESLDERVARVRDAFEATYPRWDEYDRYIESAPSLVRVYEDYVIAKRGRGYYRIDYTEEEGQIRFATADNWQSGRWEFILDATETAETASKPSEQDGTKEEPAPMADDTSEDSADAADGPSDTRSPITESHPDLQDEASNALAELNAILSIEE